MADDTGNENEAPARKPFATFLMEHKRGALADELAEKLQEVVAAVTEHGKNGSITLKLAISPAKDGFTVFVSDEVSAKVPQADRGGSIMFPDANGNLHRQDPNQMELTPLKAVPTSDGGVAVIDHQTGEVKEIGR